MLNLIISILLGIMTVFIGIVTFFIVSVLSVNLGNSLGMEPTYFAICTLSAITVMCTCILVYQIKNLKK